MSFWEDDLQYFYDDFGVTVTVDPDGFKDTFLGILDNEYLATDVGFTTDLATRQPMLTCTTTDADKYLTQGTILEVETVRYTVVNIESNGTGNSEVPLHTA